MQALALSALILLAALPSPSATVPDERADTPGAEPATVEPPTVEPPAVEPPTVEPPTVEPGEVAVCLFLGTSQTETTRPERAGFVRVADDLRERGFDVAVFGWGRSALSFLGPRRAARHEAADCLAAGRLRLLGGYSLGARAALRVARKADGRPIDVLFLVAPAGQRTLRVPESVQTAFVASIAPVEVVVGGHTRALVVNVPDGSESDEPLERWAARVPMLHHARLDDHPDLLDLLVHVADELATGRVPTTEDLARRLPNPLPAPALRRDAADANADDADIDAEPPPTKH